MGSIDIWIIASYLVATTVLGVWLGRGQQSGEDFFLGGRDLPWFALLLSIVATETSTVTFLSVPGLTFTEGGDFYFLQLALGYILGRLLVVLILLPMHFAGRPVTAYQVLEQRFGIPTRQTASVVFLLARTLGDGMRLYLAALALHHLLNWNMIGCVAVMAIATGIYAFWGGVKSVVWNDCLQFAIYTLGALIVGWIVISRLPGGWEQVTAFAAETGRNHFFDFHFQAPADAKHITFWSGLFGGAFLSLATHGADQLIVQRYLCARDKRSASLALLLSGPVVYLQFALFLVIGLAVACYFQQFDPSRLTLGKDEALANFIVSELPVGLRGLILAAVFAAAMSTLSSSVNSSASSLLDDFMAPWTKAWPDAKRLFGARLLTAMFTLAQALVAIGVYQFVSDQSTVSSVLSIAGFAAGLLLGLYFLGMLAGKGENWQAITALIIGGAVTTLAWTNKVDGLWFSVIGAATTFGTGALLRLLVPSPKQATAQE